MTTTTTTPMYIPGTCNIGPEEIKMRRNAGWIGLVVTLLLGALLVYLSSMFPSFSPWIRLILFFPATLGALGFLQAAFHFCVAFGMEGLFNVSEEVGKKETVSQQEFRKQDKSKAIQIISYSVIIGLVVAIAAVYI